MKRTYLAAEGEPTARPHRGLLIGLALASLCLAWFWMGRIPAQGTWYRNANMDVENIAEALSLNLGLGTGVVDEPAATTRYLLALDLRLRHDLGSEQVWTAKRLSRSAGPLADLARLVRIERQHARILVVLFVLLAAGCVGHATGRFASACLATVLLSGCSGLLLHGMLLRPELLCVGFGGVLAMHCAWLAQTSRRPDARALWLVLAGTCLGLALLSKLPAVLYLAVILIWCGIAPLLPLVDGGPSPATRLPSIRTLAVALTASLATLGMLHLLGSRSSLLDPTALDRLRLLAVSAALLPVLLLLPAGIRGFAHLVGWMLDLVMLISGLLAAFLLSYGLLLAVLPGPVAADCFAKLLNTLLHPDPLVPIYILPTASYLPREIGRFFMETPALVVSSALLGIGLAFFRSAHPRGRALTLLFLAQAAGMLILLSKRRYFDHYGIFVEVPLLLAWCAGLSTLNEWWRRQATEAEVRWPVAVAITAASILILAVPLQLRQRYQASQGNDTVPVNGLTVTFLYGHDTYPASFLSAMKSHYPNRQEFAEGLNRYLADPANRR